jgi:S-adenosylmethionine-diacylglycerol 3-amino-3-carboxypropyl transferase
MASPSLAAPQPPASLTERVLRHAHDALFARVHTSTLIYNTCWEDPRLDRQMLGLEPESRVVMITSAGCNALDYLLDGPAAIHAVDVNPRQNALLELKLALFRHGDFAELFRVFGEGLRPGFRQLLRRLPGLPRFAREFWESKHSYFEPGRLNSSFYYRGAAGRVAWVAMRGLARVHPHTRPLVTALLEAANLEQQAGIYAHLERAFWNGFSTWLVNQPLTMAMLGVPRPQIRIIEQTFPGGLTGYIRAKLEHVFTRVPIHDNYFWRVYFTGRYTPDCCPNYLAPAHFETLRERSARIRTHTTTLAGFLREHPGRYSHFVLLDHQDWLAAHDAEALAEEWELILANSRPGARILMRSASPEIDYLPPAARRRLRLLSELADKLHPLDRVGTYGSTLLAEVC